MKVYKYLPPYQKTGKTTFPESVNRTGVYLIKKDNKICYVGRSGYNIYKTMYRHFQKWRHSKQKVVSYADQLKRYKFSVRIIYCTVKQSLMLEKALILKHKPKDNAIKYDMFTADSYTNATLETYTKTKITEECPF